MGLETESAAQAAETTRPDGTGRWRFECPECEYDDAEHGQLLRDDQEHCPLCWLESRHVVAVTRWLPDAPKPLRPLTPAELRQREADERERLKRRAKNKAQRKARKRNRQ